jgi:arylsulfatase A-like enzyme
VLNVDIAPTLLDLAGLAIPSSMQGRSFRDILQGKKVSGWRQSFYYHYFEYPGAHSVKRHYGIRNSRYKLIHYYYDIDCWELFDLKLDPEEINNVYDHPDYLKLRENLKRELNLLREELGVKEDI